MITGHFARVRPSGFWIPGSVIGSAEVEQLDQQSFQSVDGDGGGTYSNASVLAWGGSFGHAFSCPVAFASSAVLTFATGAAMSGNVNTPSELVFTGVGVRIAGGAYLELSTNSFMQLNSSSNYITVSAGAHIDLATGSPGGLINMAAGSEILCAGSIVVQSGGLVVVQSGATLSGLSGSIVALGGTNSLSGTNTIGGTLALSATTTRTGSETVSGAAAWDTLRTHTLTTTTPQTLTGTDFDVWIVQTTLGASQQLNINDGTSIGQHTKFIRGPGQVVDNNPCQINVTGSGPWFLLQNVSGYIEFMWTGTAWLPIAASHGLSVFN